MKKPQLKPKTVKMLRSIQREIKKEPRQFIMDTWFEHRRSIPNCHTAACIAGWAIAKDEKVNLRKASISAHKYSFNLYQAMEALGITYEQAEVLFYEDSWPEQFKMWDNNDPLWKRAIDRIDYFIKTGGK